MSMCTGTYVCIVACANATLEATSTTLLQVLFTLFGDAKSLVSCDLEFSKQARLAGPRAPGTCPSPLHQRGEQENT